MTTSANFLSNLYTLTFSIRVLPMCGHTFCMACIVHLVSKDHGTIICPECRKSFVISCQPLISESVNRELVTNAMAIPKRSSTIIGGDFSAVQLLPEASEIEERFPRDGFEEVKGEVFPFSEHRVKRMLTYLIVLCPIIIAMLCQPAYVRNVILCFLILPATPINR